MTADDWRTGRQLLSACEQSHWRHWQGLHDWLEEMGYPWPHDLYVLTLGRDAFGGALGLWVLRTARERIADWITSEDS